MSRFARLPCGTSLRLRLCGAMNASHRVRPTVPPASRRRWVCNKYALVSCAMCTRSSDHVRWLGVVSLLIILFSGFAFAEPVQLCRLQFEDSPDGDSDGGWYVDYPRADVNLATRISEVTKIRFVKDDAGVYSPRLVKASDTAMMQCPLVLMTEPGAADFSDAEQKGLRSYLLKGGFLWADDFWGSNAWNWWATQVAKILPPSEYPIVDIPMNHPMLHNLFDVKSIPQVPNVGLWEREQKTSERGDDSATVHFRGVYDKKHRLMMVMTHNTDFGDSFEQEQADPEYFRRFSVPAYAIGADILLYALTH
jgi:hypothetical protein